MKQENNTEYRAAQNMHEVLAMLGFNEPLEDDDPRYVPTELGRGEFSIKALLKDLGVDNEKEVLRTPLKRSYNLLCGHIGCGKSTELRQLAGYLERKKIFLVVYLDCESELNQNNLHYPDIMLGLANKLFERLAQKSINMDKSSLHRLKAWFSKKIETNTKLKNISTEVTAGGSTVLDIPFFVRLFSTLTNQIKNDSSYKKEIREVVKNSFAELTGMFNDFLPKAETVLEKNEGIRKLLFIIDGTDKMEPDESHRLFIQDINQLTRIEANFIYCGPIHLLYENLLMLQKFDHHTLPMIKIFQKGSNEKFQEGFNVLRQLIFRRIASGLFEAETVVDAFIKFSGGSTRLLLRLLKYARRVSDMKKFRRQDVERAVHLLARDYWRFLRKEDYKTLCRVGNGENVGSSPVIKKLLLNLAILEYNSGWWSPHPVVKQLDGYKKMEDERLGR